MSKRLKTMSKLPNRIPKLHQMKMMTKLKLLLPKTSKN